MSEGYGSSYDAKIDRIYDKKKNEQKHNQISVIKPYLWNGIWVFDDPDVGLIKEALVAGVPELIVIGTKQFGIENPEKGFLIRFSKDPFPGHQIKLDWVCEEMNGNWYEWKEVNQTGWLCPALLNYFTNPPANIYLELLPLPKS